MTEMVERVARAICWRSIKQHVNNDGVVDHTGCPSGLMCAELRKCLENPDLLRLSTYWASARAVIAAMREPTEAMVIEGEAHFFEHASEADDWALRATRNAYRAMIDAALAEQ
jgi:hypothetical protein